MSVHIRYFASLKESLGCAEQQIEIADSATIKDVWALANPNRALPANILMAINMDYADADAEVSDGDEVAFFPPVTGG